MTRQHVFPDRLRHVLPKFVNPERAVGGRTKIVRNGKTIRSADSSKVRQGHPGQFKIRKVCGDCNSVWLKAMEEECIPLVERIAQGETPILRRPDQVKLVKVATSISMVGEWISDEFVSTTQAERAAFRATALPPPQWFAFVGRDATSIGAPKFMSDGCSNSGPYGRDAPKKEFSSFTLGIGPLLLHVASFRDGVFVDPDHYAAKLGLAAIWPPTDWINFGLMPALNTADIARIRSYATESFRKLHQGK